MLIPGMAKEGGGRRGIHYVLVQNVSVEAARESSLEKGVLSSAVGIDRLDTEPLKTLYVLLPKGPALGVFRPLLGISPIGLVVWGLLTFTIGAVALELFTVRKGVAYSNSIGIMTLWDLVHLILLLRPLYHRLSLCHAHWIESSSVA